MVVANQIPRGLPSVVGPSLGDAKRVEWVTVKGKVCHVHAAEVCGKAEFACTVSEGPLRHSGGSGNGPSRRPPGGGGWASSPVALASLTSDPFCLVGRAASLAPEGHQAPLVVSVEDAKGAGAAAEGHTEQEGAGVETLVALVGVELRDVVHAHARLVLPRMGRGSQLRSGLRGVAPLRDGS